MKTLSLFPHTHVVPNLYELFSVEHEEDMLKHVGYQAVVGNNGKKYHGS